MQMTKTTPSSQIESIGTTMNPLFEATTDITVPETPVHLLNPPSTNKKTQKQHKQRSIHDFFSQSSSNKKPKSIKKKREISKLFGDEQALKKRITFEHYRNNDDDLSDSNTNSQSSDVSLRPKRIDFNAISCSQRSEPDIEPISQHPSQKSYTPTYDYQRSSSLGYMFSQDDMEFCTPQDQPVMHLSHPTTPTPMKKRNRRNDNADIIHADEVQNITQNFMDINNYTGLNESNEKENITDTSLQTPASNKRRKSIDSNLSDTTSFENPFAPPLSTRGRKSRRNRQSFPTSWNNNLIGHDFSKYLSTYTELELIGSGAFSRVYKCLKKLDGWIYAVKKSRRHVRGRADTERVLREVHALAALSNSRYIVRYYDAWFEDDLLYIQLEHCRSCTLSMFVDSHKPNYVPEHELCKILSDIASGLRDMHALKIVHMDVKLQNILIDTDDTYKLGDLGTVAHMDGRMEITEGDNRYLSRELLEGSRSNLRAGDIFALGATIYELALGKELPNGGEQWQDIRNGNLVIFRHYSNSLQHLISNMMHPDPLQRPSAEEILQHEVVIPFR